MSDRTSEHWDWLRTCTAPVHWWHPGAPLAEVRVVVVVDRDVVAPIALVVQRVGESPHAHPRHSHDEDRRCYPGRKDAASRLATCEGFSRYLSVSLRYCVAMLRAIVREIGVFKANEYVG